MAFRRWTELVRAHPTKSAALGRHLTYRRPSPMSVTRRERPPCQAARARCAVDSGAFWQRNVFRSSFPGCVGRQMSFGVVETPSARPLTLSQGNMMPQKGCSLLILLF